MRRALAAAALAGLIAPGARAEAPKPVTVACYEIPSFRIGRAGETEFGPFRWLGGIEIEADTRDFGGFSALAFAGDRLVSVSDNALWLTAKLDADADGRPRCLAEPQLGAMVGTEGEGLFGKDDSDTESMALGVLDGTPVAYIGFEGHARILAYPLDAASGPGRPQAVAVPFDRHDLRFSKGLEALALAPQGHPLAGSLIAIAERTLDDKGDFRAWIIGGPRPGAFTIERRDDFDVTDAAFLPDGDLLVLERRFRPSDGVAMRIGRVRPDQLVAGARVVAEMLIDADMRYQIDNMEGLAVSEGPAGETIVTLVSDDNHSIFQRNLLLRFVYAGRGDAALAVRPPAAAAAQ
ncbi:MAG TPA: esterase-like activity of phytase family protein [Kaistiaceae bacterium]|nr:esterase-like activity of phytase family protein [Kaistiaceae bacterium]